MIPAAATVPSHSLNTLDRIAFYKSVREKRKQLQLNPNNGKESRSPSTENTFLTQMLQSSSSTGAVTPSNGSSLSIASLLRKGDLSPSSSSPHRTVTNTLTNILPALLNGTLSSSQTHSTLDPTLNGLTLASPSTPNTTNTVIESKSSTSLPVSPTVPTNKSLPVDSVQQQKLSNSTISPPGFSGTSSNPPHSLSAASSCPALNTSSSIVPSGSPSPVDSTLKIARSASVKSCASDSGVSSSSPLSDNNIVHVFRTHHQETINLSQHNNHVSRKRKSLANVYEELNKDKKFSKEAAVSSTFNVPTTNSNIPYSQQEAITFSYAQYAFMQTITQQLRANYPAAFLHAAAAAAAAASYLPLSSPLMNANKTGPESDDNNNHIRVTSASSQDQPYQRETYRTLLESSQILTQQTLPKPVPIDLRKSPTSKWSNNQSPLLSNMAYLSSSFSSTSSVGSPPCSSPPKSNSSDGIHEFVCIPKKLMPVVSGRINDWLERNLNFFLSLSVINQTLSNDQEKRLLLSHIWHRLVLISMIENSFEIYVTKDLQIIQDVVSSPTMTHPTETDVKQIESLIHRGKTLDIDEIGFNLIREVIIYKEGKTLFHRPEAADAFEKAECQAQARLTNWCSSKVKYSKIVFFLCNIYQVKQDIFERLFCSGSAHQTTPIQICLDRLLVGASGSNG